MQQQQLERELCNSGSIFGCVWLIEPEGTGNIFGRGRKISIRLLVRSRGRRSYDYHSVGNDVLWSRTQEVNAKRGEEERRGISALGLTCPWLCGFPMYTSFDKNSAARKIQQFQSRSHFSQAKGFSRTPMLVHPFDSSRAVSACLRKCPCKYVGDARLGLLVKVQQRGCQ